jgi:creatinine amidohydrolase
MTNTPAWGRYAELRPAELEQILDASPVAYLPWGAFEWHGPHLPLGSEGFIAEQVAERVVRRTGGVLFPTTWWPIAPIPHRFSIGIRSELLHEVWDDLFGELSRVGFKLVVVPTGHHGFGHDLVLMDAAEHAMQQHPLLVLAVPPMALVDERMLDHAAHWETALVMSVRPRLAAVEQLDGLALEVGTTGVMGDDPRSATAGQGESALRLATERLTLSVQALMDGSPHAILRELYLRRRATQQAYVDRYFRGSWEEAIHAWWRDTRQPRR